MNRYVVVIIGLIFITSGCGSKAEENQTQTESTQVVETQKSPTSGIVTGKKVKFDYVLTVEGQVIDTSQGKDPFEYVHGQGGIIPGLAKQLEGLSVGDERTITVAPEEGYGPVNPQAYREVTKENLPADLDPQVGVVLQIQGNDGRAYAAVIEQVNETSVVLNFNHPLAGRTLQFNVKILEII